MQFLLSIKVMDELVQDLTSALEESELKIDVDEESHQEFLHKRRIRKRRPVICNVLLKPTGTCNMSAVAYDIRKAHVSELNVTGSDTESGFVLPAIRKHRRKKIKRMETGSTHLKINQNLKKNEKHMDLEMCDVTDRRKQLEKLEDESGISASDDSNDDTTAQDGDDEMTDYFNEPGGGSVCGVPSILPWWDEAVDDSRIKHLINGSLLHMPETTERGYHARMNRLPGMAARSIRRGRRRIKCKKPNERIRCIEAQSKDKEHKNRKRRTTDEILGGAMKS